MTSADKNCSDDRQGFVYHPFEVAFSGYAGSGKTEVICDVLKHWGTRHRVGYVKRDTDSIILDTDAYEASRAGAAVTMTNGAHRLTHMTERSSSRFDRAHAFVDVDFVLAEGHTDSAMTKLLVLDGAGRALKSYRAGKFENVVALVSSGDSGEGHVDVPVFRRDDVAEVAEFVEANVRQRASAPLYGLVLVGGRSRRMGREKWALAYRNEPQALRTAGLLGGVCGKVFVSARPDQDLTGLAKLQVIEDRFPEWGPTTGILSAMEKFPDAAWLVAACDLPFLEQETLDDLVSQRDVLKIATAFKNAENDLPEPLCAVWEPRSRQRILQAVAIGIRCPRKVLVESHTNLLNLANRQALDNANTPTQYDAARKSLSEDS